jgi:hypothetical protein
MKLDLLYRAHLHCILVNKKFLLLGHHVITNIEYEIFEISGSVFSCVLSLHLNCVVFDIVEQKFHATAMKTVQV